MMEGEIPNENKLIDPRFTGDAGDPEFAPSPQLDNSIHDTINALVTQVALEHPELEVAAPHMDQSEQGEDPDAPKPMSEQDLVSLIKKKVESSHQWWGSGKLATKRIQADKYYRGEPRGDEQEGRSAVVSRDVAEAVDGAMPSMMRVFAGGEQVCAFEPHGPEDEEAAKQATDYINHIFMGENEGFMILYTWIKDSLLKKNGIVKAWHDVRLKRTKETYQGLTQEQLTALQQDPNLKIENIQPSQEVIQQTDPATGTIVPVPIQVFSCVVTQTKPEKRIRVENVPPDEFIIERRAVSIYTANFLAHRGRRTISDLIESGYARDKVMAIPVDDDMDYSGERTERFNEDDSMPYDEAGDQADPMMRKVWVTDAYIKCDFDGDGFAEWRCVTIAGTAGGVQSLLGNYETDDHPFSDLTPDPEPHKFYGQSMFDKTYDIQDIKTALIRGILDSTYLANAPRLGFVEGQVNVDDLLDARPGGPVRMKRADAIVPIPTELVSNETMQVVSYIDSVKEKRTGISQLGAGLNPNILNSSATGADIINNNNQQRLELMCRIFAETGVKRLFRVIFKLVCQYQDVPRMVKLRNKWVQVNPRDWKDKMDVSATVGLGLGSKTQQASVAMQLLQLDQQIVQMQQGLDGPFIKPENVYNKLAKLVEAVGWKTPDPYYTDPKTWTPPPPKPPTPDQQVKLAELQSKATQATASADSAKANALSSIQTNKIDYEMKKLDYAIKQVELEALKFQTENQLAARADNKTGAGKVMYSSAGQRIAQ